MSKRRKKLQKSRMLFQTVIFIFVLTLGVLTLSLLLTKQVQQSSHIASNTPKDSIQIETFLPGSNSPSPTVSPTIPISTLTPITTISPTPTAVLCSHDTNQPITPGCVCAGWFVIVCENKKCIHLKESTLYDPNGPDVIPKDPLRPCESNDPNWAWVKQETFDSACRKAVKNLPPVAMCFGKPVIYLYPTSPTYVDVSVKTEGKIVISDPLYPSDGWKKVLANPDGTLLYKGKAYRELFYETEVYDFKPPSQGVIIKTDELSHTLLTLITQLGLSREDEQREFLDWWVPKLKALNSPYIFFSVIDASEKKRFDNVTISPKPDTLIEFIAYFKAMNKKVDVPNLVITQPVRRGFTAVEWGGVIDTR